MTAAQVQLLGKARAKLGEDSVAFLPDKRHQLLAYLAYQGDWVGRDELAFLFWPDVPDRTARHSLRQLLKRVRKLDWLSGLEADARRVRWHVETDVGTLDRALHAERWHQALERYPGRLLSGLEGTDSPSFEEWLEHERRQLHNRWRDALFGRAHELEAGQRHLDAAPLYASVLEADDLDEEALRSYVQALHQAGQHDRALRAYEAFADRLDQELGMRPTTVTEQLAFAIRDALASPSLTPTPVAVDVVPPSPSVAGPPTPFIGRDLELAEIAHSLSITECRLLTLVGPGGVGKSRIALQASEELERRYPDGCHFVPLDALTTADAIPSAIAARLGLTLRGTDDALTQVTRQLRDKRLLLVLDDFDRLVAGAATVSRLLAACPEVELLVTSRQRLGVNEEWLLPIHGLPYPETDELPLDDALHYDAIRLLVQHARRMRPHFELGGGDLGDAIEICALVTGLPLGIELAAAWTRVMSLRDIAHEIRLNVDFLTTAASNQVPRHRSIRAAFEHSWKLLTPAEQEALSRLSVFSGGFRREAAAAVAGATVAVLAALIDKSLLRLLPEGRYDRHPVLYQFTQEKLAEHPDEERLAREKHAKHYLWFAETAEQQLGKAQQLTSLGQLDEEVENLRAALRWARHAPSRESGLRLAGALGRYWDIRGMYREGRAHLEWFLGEAPSGQTAALAKALHAAATLAWRQGDAVAAQAHAESSLAIGQKARDRHIVAGARSVLGMVAHYNHGDRERAMAHYERALEASQASRDEAGMARALHLLGILLHDIGDNAAAREHFERELELCRRLEDTLGSADALNSLATVLYSQGQNTPSRALYEESLQLYRRIGDRARIGQVLGNLGNVAANAGEVELASRLHEESLQLRREIGDPWEVSHALKDVAGDAYRRGAYAKAQSLHEESLAMRRDLGDKWRISDSLRHLGDALHAQGKRDQAMATFEESLALRREIGYKWGIGHSLRPLAALRIELGDTDTARTMLTESLALARELGDQKAIILTIEGFAEVAAAEGAFERSVRWWSAADAWRKTAGTPRTQREQELCERALHHAQEHLTAETFATASAEGRTIDLDHAAAEVTMPVPRRATSASAGRVARRSYRQARDP